MTSKARIVAAWRGEPHDHVPLTTWSFGFRAPQMLRWRRDGCEVQFWYTKRLEHLHLLPQPWELEDDFHRVLAWRSVGVDDILDVSVPWSMSGEVSWTDSQAEAGELDSYPVLIREYQTPVGAVRHAVRKTGEDMGPGWVLQPDCVPLFEDFNIPRGVKHLVSQAAEVPAVECLYQRPDGQARAWFAERMCQVTAFAEREAVPVQAWPAFGMDGVVWLTGVEGAVFMAVDEPKAFGRLLDIITETDYARTQLALETPGVDMVVERAWYASTEVWSPRLLDQFYFPHLKVLADLAHRHGKPFAVVITAGIEALAERLIAAGVDVLYFVDPVEGRISLERAAEVLADRITIVGGVSSLSLGSGPEQVATMTRHAMDVLGRTQRFILQPVDSLYPDTSWEGLEAMIQTWKSYW